MNNEYQGINLLCLCFNIIALCVIQNVSLPQQEISKVLREANQELVNIARRDQPSVLRDRTYGGLTQENWMIQLVKEITTRCPTIAKILSSLFDCSLLNPGKKLPQICLIYGIIMFLRCHELSRIQRINSVLLTQGQASANVSNIKTL